MNFFRAPITGMACATALFAISFPTRVQGNANKKNSELAEVVTRGKAQFKANCVICHYETSDKKKVGPGLKGFGTHSNFADGTKITETRLHDLIANGGKDMPPFLEILSDAQIRDLISYLKTL